MPTVRTARDIGAALRTAREGQGLTQATVAERARVSRRWLIAMERGEHPRAELDRVLRVLEALQLDVTVGPVAAVRPSPAPAEVFDLSAHLASFRSGT
jgi:HTH-type transcriptional regulator/antitoxin HipB